MSAQTNILLKLNIYDQKSPKYQTPSPSKEKKKVPNPQLLFFSPFGWSSSYCIIALLGSFKSKQLIIGLGYTLKAQVIVVGFIRHSFNDSTTYQRGLAKWVRLGHFVQHTQIRVLLPVGVRWWASLVGLTPHMVQRERLKLMSDRRSTQGCNIYHKGPHFFLPKKKKKKRQYNFFPKKKIFGGGGVCKVSSNTLLSILNNISHFFTHMYIKNTQTPLPNTPLMKNVITKNYFTIFL